MITDNLDPNKIYKISFKKGITINPLTWLGGLIRLIAKVEYNHTAILFNIDSDWCLQEAIGEQLGQVL